MLELASEAVFETIFTSDRKNLTGNSPKNSLPMRADEIQTSLHNFMACLMNSD